MTIGSSSSYSPVGDSSIGVKSLVDAFFRTDENVGASNSFTIESSKKNLFFQIRFILIPSSFVHVSPSSRTICSVGDNSFVSLNTIGFSVEGRLVRSK